MSLCSFLDTKLGWGLPGPEAFVTPNVNACAKYWAFRVLNNLTWAPLTTFHFLRLGFVSFFTIRWVFLILLTVSLRKEVYLSFFICKLKVDFAPKFDLQWICARIHSFFNLLDSQFIENDSIESDIRFNTILLFSINWESDRLEKEWFKYKFTTTQILAQNSLLIYKT